MRRGGSGTIHEPYALKLQISSRTSVPMHTKLDSVCVQTYQLPCLTSNLGTSTLTILTARVGGCLLGSSQTSGRWERRYVLRSPWAISSITTNTGWPCDTTPSSRTTWCVLKALQKQWWNGILNPFCNTHTLGGNRSTDKIHKTTTWSVVLCGNKIQSLVLKEDSTLKEGKAILFKCGSNGKPWVPERRSRWGGFCTRKQAICGMITMFPDWIQYLLINTVPFKVSLCQLQSALPF